MEAISTILKIYVAERYSQESNEEFEMGFKIASENPGCKSDTLSSDDHGVVYMIYQGEYPSQDKILAFLRQDDYGELADELEEEWAEEDSRKFNDTVIEAIEQ